MYGALVACLVIRSIFIVTWWVCIEAPFIFWYITYIDVIAYHKYSRDSNNTLIFFLSGFQGVPMAQTFSLRLFRYLHVRFSAVEHWQYRLWFTQVSVWNDIGNNTKSLVINEHVPMCETVEQSVTLRQFMLLQSWCNIFFFLISRTS